MTHEDRNGAGVFAHKNNIRTGMSKKGGRVLWGTSTTDASGHFHLPGWVLPGGRRTTDEQAARAVALTIDEMARGVA